MKQTLLKVLKTIFSDVRQAAVPAILLLFVGGSAGLLVFSQKALDFSIQIANTPTPLWATTLLALLCCLYMYLKYVKANPSSPPKKHKTKYFTIGNYKWEVKIYDSGAFSVEKDPFCVVHDLRFIFGNNGKYCPGPEKEKCNNHLSEYDEFKVYESAKSIIENKVRNKEY